MDLDYPRTLAELEERFSNQDACLLYLEQLRWPEGFVCPVCGGDGWKLKNGTFQCHGCARQTSVTSGTLFHGTRTPLRVWFRAIWWVVSQKNGASALGLQRVLGLGSYETAWAWLHKLRRAMVSAGRERLSGEVEVDETMIGGLEEGVRGRQTETKAVVLVAAECRGRATGRIRLQQTRSVAAEPLHAFIRENIEPGSVVITDGWKGYCGIDKHGYEHRSIPLRGDRRKATTELPRVHRVASLLWRWLLGTHQGAVSKAHIDYYLDEFVFRFNRRTSRSRGLLFRRLLENAVEAKAPEYSEIIKHVRGPGRRHHGRL